MQKSLSEKRLKKLIAGELNSLKKSLAKLAERKREELQAKQAHMVSNRPVKEAQMNLYDLRDKLQMSFENIKTEFQYTPGNQLTGSIQRLFEYILSNVSKMSQDTCADVVRMLTGFLNDLRGEFARNNTWRADENKLSKDFKVRIAVLKEIEAFIVAFNNKYVHYAQSMTKQLTYDSLRAPNVRVPGRPGRPPPPSDDSSDDNDVSRGGPAPAAEGMSSRGRGGRDGRSGRGARKEDSVRSLEEFLDGLEEWTADAVGPAIKPKSRAAKIAAQSAEIGDAGVAPGIQPTALNFVALPSSKITADAAIKDAVESSNKDYWKSLVHGYARYYSEVHTRARQLIDADKIKGEKENFYPKLRQAISREWAKS